METLSCANLALVWKGLDIGALNLENMLIIAGFFSVASWWFFAPICTTPIMLKFGIKAYTIDFRKHANLRVVCSCQLCRRCSGLAMLAVSCYNPIAIA